jgi:hypothetical protein
MVRIAISVEAFEAIGATLQRSAPIWQVDADLD